MKYQWLEFGLFNMYIIQDLRKKVRLKNVREKDIKRRITIFSPL